MRLLTIAVVLVLALAGASCGGDDETSGDSDDVTIETTTDETTTDETTDEATDETTDDEDTTGSFASAECQGLISASAALGQAFAAAGSGDDVEAAGETFQEAVDDAPEEIRADLQIIADAYSEYLEVVEDAGLEPGETPSQEQALELSQALASIDVAEYSAASQRFTTWAAANCN